MTQKTSAKKQSLIQRLKDPCCKSINPYEIAKEITKFHNSNNSKGVQRIYEAYLLGLVNAGKSSKRANYLVRNNLDDAAVLADMVKDCGYEASGQLLLAVRKDIKRDGPIVQFYRNCIKV